jgi:hypothetical protein
MRNPVFRPRTGGSFVTSNTAETRDIASPSKMMKITPIQWMSVDKDSIPEDSTTTNRTNEFKATNPNTIPKINDTDFLHPCTPE